MDKKEALKTLIQNSVIIDNGLKDEYIKAVNTMTDEEITMLGETLAEEVYFGMEHKEQLENTIQKIIAEAQK